MQQTTPQQWLKNNHLFSSWFCGSAVRAGLAQAVPLVFACLTHESVQSAVSS